ncbi:Putative AC transposase [Linum perenne]
MAEPPPSEATLVAPPPQHEWDDRLGVRIDTTNKRSKLWANWIQFTDHEGVIKAKCVFCGAILKADSSKIGNSSLIRHVKNCKKRNEVLAGQLRLNFQQGSGLGTADWTYCPKRLRLKIARMIIKDELPFIFFEKEGFVEMMKEASPSFKMPCRKSIQADCLKLFIEGKEEIKSFLTAKCGGKVSITTDCWTSVQNFNYICITAHFVGIDWKLHKKIINFPRIYSHKGFDIADAVAHCLEEWKLTNIFTVMVDNASANDTAIQHLKDKTYEWGTNMLQGKYMHMRCVAHVTNLIVCEGLTEVGLSVRRVRESVRYVRSSPARTARFRESIEWNHISSKRFVSLDVATSGTPPFSC